MSLEDMAYQDSRYDFENYREKINNAALQAHDEYDEVRAQELLAKARKLTYTGLMWRQDNGIED